MGRSGARLTLAFLVVVCATVFASAGGPVPRDGQATFEAFPGPVEVTYGELIAYKGTFTTLSDSTLTQVRFRQTVPAVGSQTATFDSSTCPSTRRPEPRPLERSGSADFGQVPAGTPKLELTVVWRVPASGPSPCPECLVSTGRWTVKEGVDDTTDPNDVFRPHRDEGDSARCGRGDPRHTPRGRVRDRFDVVRGTHRAGNLRTNDVISLANPVSSKSACRRSRFPSGNKNLGFASTITETPRRRAQLCRVHRATRHQLRPGAPRCGLPHAVRRAHLPRRGCCARQRQDRRDPPQRRDTPQLRGRAGQSQRLRRRSSSSRRGTRTQGLGPHRHLTDQRAIRLVT